MGLLFQPRGVGDRLAGASLGHSDDVPFDRGRVFLAALEDIIVGDSSRFPDLLTDDVVLCSPHLVVESRTAVQRAVGSPESSLTDVEIIMIALDAVADKLIGEWQLEATFSQPVLYGERLLIEPTGGPVRLSGASVAEFRGRRIKAFRHYFDDSELFVEVPGTPRHLRWSLND